MEERMKEIETSLSEAMQQPDTSNIKVSRWYPGVVEEIIENVDEKHKVNKRSSLNIEERLLQEASSKLTQKQSLQIGATKEKTVEEILNDMQLSDRSMMQQQTLDTVEEGKPSPAPARQPTQRARRRRQKMRSTPVVGGGLFGETTPEEKEEDADHEIIKQGLSGAASKRKQEWKPDFSTRGRGGTKAEIIVNGETYNIRINDETLNALRTGFSGDMLDSRGFAVPGSGVSIEPDQGNVVNMLAGYVRSPGPLGSIQEESEMESETSSTHGGSAAMNNNPDTKRSPPSE